MKRAFTLIELLVVIAIIAILAAILFPVFAQAKEAAKKTAALSQFKQVGTASQIYIADADDVFPLSMSYDTANQRWRGQASISTAVPAGAVTQTGRSVDPRKTEEQIFVLNAMAPYIKNNQIFEANGKSSILLGGTLKNPAIQGSKVNLSMNGMLHAFSATAVASPSKLPLFWQGFFRTNIDSMAFSTPLLDCGIQGNQTCQFNPGGYPQGTGSSGYGYNFFVPTVDPAVINTAVYSRSMIFVASDTSAKVGNYGSLPRWPQHAVLNVNTNPWSASDPAGDANSAYWMTDCVAPGATKGGGIPYYPGYFRPDSEFNYTTAQCDHGSG